MVNLGFQGEVAELLTVAVSSMNERELAPVPAMLYAADTGHIRQLGGDTADAVRISGTEADLLAWVLGRSDGNALARDKPGPLPSMPSIYYA